MDQTELDHGDVLIRVEYSAVNRRDAVAATSSFGMLRQAPCVAGSDLAGRVVRSAAPRFVPGMKVLATGYELGTRHHGGYAEYALLPGGWVLPVPDGLDCLEAMAIGTTGLAAAMAITRMEECGLRPERGPVIISGASGGLGSLAIDMLAGRGYEVVALTSRPERSDYLLALGAERVLARTDFETGGDLLAKAVWAGAIDVLGGAVLGRMLAATKPSGVVASLGVVEDASLQGSALAFAQRGVSVVGIDSRHAGFGVREKVWARLAGDLKPRHLDLLMRVLAFGELPQAFADIIEARSRGRTVVRVAQQGDSGEQHE